MDFIEYINTWVKSEVLQGRIMLGIGIMLLFGFVAILRSENALMRGSLIPLGLLLIVLIGYGSYILYSRPAHVKESISLYERSAKEAITQETAKHINDNKAGKTLLRIYPILMLVSVIVLFFVSAPYYKGMALGFALLFISIFIIDSGFVSRSDSFLTFLKTLHDIG